MAFDSELLDIAQAAALLRVGEASLRRWTNAGRLPCRRIGGRRERHGARALRVVGDVSGGRLAREGDFDHVLEYEAGYERLSRRFPVTTACLYDARSYSGLETARLVQRHPDLFRHPDAHFVS